MRLAPALALPILLGGCTAVENTSADRFAATGELIALSGADAGARNACFTCHGLNGMGDGNGAPRLAGLDSGYLERQMIAYADGRRQHPQMAWIAERLDDAERRAVSVHYAQLPGPERTPAAAEPMALYHAGDPERGLPACADCHGERGEGGGAGNPLLAGQSPAYLAQQLEQWRGSRRRNDPGDVMLRISQLLTPAESLALSEYAAGLAGGPDGPRAAATSPSARRGDPRSGVSALPLHEPESARTTR